VTGRADGDQLRRGNPTGSNYGMARRRQYWAGPETGETPHSSAARTSSPIIIFLFFFFFVTLLVFSSSSSVG